MKKSFGEVIIGLIIIFIGTGFLLDALNIADFSSMLANWWPMFVVLVGLVSLMSNPRVFVWPVLIIAVGILLQLRELGVLNFNFWGLFWPVAIIIFGLTVLFKAQKTKPEELNDALPDIFAGFSGHNTRLTSSDFKGAKLTAIFGGIELDLTEAALKKEAKIEAFAAFGGIDLRVPEGWNVQVNGLPLFGGWEDKTRTPKEKDAPTLYIKGTCLFGGVSVKN